LGRYIEIKLPRCLILLTKAELLALLAGDKELWTRGIRRGKYRYRMKGAEKQRPRLINRELH